VLSKDLPQGSWVVEATANLSVFNTSFDPNHDETRTSDCVLHNTDGNVIGSASDRRVIPEDGGIVSASLALNGGVVAGSSGGNVSLFCRSAGDGADVDEAQMMIIQVGGLS
jgi:hypothetical protein